MKRVIVHIDRLVLNGFRHENRYTVADGLREELARQLSSPDAVRHLIPAGDWSRSNIDEIRIGTADKPSQIARLAARSIGWEVKQ